MKKVLSTLMALALVLALAVPGVAMATGPDSPVPAFDYAPEVGTFEAINDGVVKVYKHLVMEDKAEVPPVTFSYTIAPATGADADGYIVKPTSTTLPVYPGVTGAADIEDVVFAGTETTTAGLPTDDPAGTATSGYKYATKDITLNFENCNFDKPGVYRYILTEVKPAAADAFLYDTFAEHTDNAHTTAYKRTIDVYVESVDEVAGQDAVAASWTYAGTDYPTEAEAQAVKAAAEAAGGDNEGQDLPITANPAQAAVDAEPAKLKVVAAVCYEGDIEDAAVNQVYDPAGTQGEYVIGLATGNGAATKTDSYVNEYQTEDLQVTKFITGNQGDKEDTFFITVKLENIPKDTKVTVYKAKNADTPINPADNTTYDSTAVWTADDTNKIEQTVELGHKGRILVKAIPVGTTYTVNELTKSGGTALNANGKTEDGYTVTYAATNTGTVAVDDGTTLYTVDVTNTRTGVIPTGVAMGVGGTIVLLGAAILYFVIRRRTAEYED
ncbi:MAG: hypothetical protein IJL66_07230 [Lachnospiraceae bacterium]|nr:hypothetical protein [Lachnospiraceae bacterium]